MDSCFSLTGAHQRRVNERGKSPCIKDLLLPRWVQSTLCKRQLHTTHVGAVGWELQGSSATIDMRGEGGSGVTLIYVPVAASGKRKTEENLIFHDNFIQCFTEKLSFFCAAFLREYSCICSHNVLLLPAFYAMLSPGNFKAPLTLSVKKKRMVRFEGLPEFKWSDLGNRMWLDKAHSERFLWFSIEVVKTHNWIYLESTYWDLSYVREDAPTRVIMLNLISSSLKREQGY